MSVVLPLDPVRRWTAPIATGVASSPRTLSHRRKTKRAGMIAVGKREKARVPIFEQLPLPLSMTSGPGRQGWVEKPEATGPVDHGWTTGERACALPNARTVGMKSLPYSL
jgi:hypothetical protein